MPIPIKSTSRVPCHFTLTGQLADVMIACMLQSRAAPKDVIEYLLGEHYKKEKSDLDKFIAEHHDAIAHIGQINEKVKDDAATGRKPHQAGQKSVTAAPESGTKPNGKVSPSVDGETFTHVNG